MPRDHFHQPDVTLSDNLLNARRSLANADNVTSLIHRNLGLLRGFFPGVGRLKDGLQLLKRLTGCFDEKEVDDGEFNALSLSAFGLLTSLGCKGTHDPANVHNIQLPANLLHSDGNTVSVDHNGDVQEEE